LGPVIPAADLPGRRKLRSGGISRRLVPPERNLPGVQQSVTGRAFTVAGHRVWNTLPEGITTSQSLSVNVSQPGSSENHTRTSSSKPAYFLINLLLTLKLVCY